MRWSSKAISWQKKISLYRHASFLVLISHYEGFGLPLLEAMADS